MTYSASKADNSGMVYATYIVETLLRWHNRGDKMKYEISLNEVKLRQLDRLINNTRIDFRKAFMIIFSDYPSRAYIDYLETASDLYVSGEYSFKLINNFNLTKVELSA